MFLAKGFGVNQKTVWKVGHEIRSVTVVHADAIGLLPGIVELNKK